MAWDEDVGWVIGDPEDEGGLATGSPGVAIDPRLDGDPLLSDKVIDYYETERD